MTNQILLVEDNHILQLLGRNQFDVLGVGLDVAYCGESAIERMQNNDYQLVLMDIGLPKMDGIEATIAMRKFELQNSRPHLPIVAVTALYQREIALAAGMDDFVQKPLLLDDLVAVLRKWAPAVRINRKVVSHKHTLEKDNLDLLAKTAFLN